MAQSSTINPILERILTKDNWDSAALFVRGYSQPFLIFQEHRSTQWKVDRGYLILPLGKVPSPFEENKFMLATVMINSPEVVRVEFYVPIKESLIQQVPTIVNPEGEAVTSQSSNMEVV